MTPPEVKLWAVLRTRPDGLRFRRQHPLGIYVLDFYCPAAKLAIEVDGLAHDLGDNPARDQARDEWLDGQGVATLRLPAVDVMRDLDAVVRHILDHCAIPLHRFAVPLPSGAGEDNTD